MTRAPTTITVQPAKLARVFHLAVLFLAFGGAILVGYGTVWGAGLISDSFQYVASAKNYASTGIMGYPSDYGVTIPLTQYPPLFPIVLAFFVMAGVNALDAARWLNATLFGVNIFLIAISIRQFCSSEKFALLGALLALVAFPLVQTHSWVLSEPLYLALSLTGMLLLAKHLERSGMSWLVGASVFIALSFLTRYVGLSLFITGLCALLLNRRQDLRRRLKETLTFALLIILPLGAWTMRNYSLTSTLNNRSIGWAPLTPKNLASAVNTLLTWFIPNHLVLGREKMLVYGGAIAIIGIIIAYIVISRTHPDIRVFFTDFTPSPYLFHLHLSYVVFYFLTIIVSKIFFDNNIGFTDRMLVPTLVSLIILLSSCLALAWKTDKQAIGAVVLALSLYIVFYHGAITAVNLPKQHRQGLGIARKSWHNSETIQSLRSFHNLPVYSNSPSSLYLWSDRTGFTLQDFERRVNDHVTGEAILVIFHHIPRNARADRLTNGLQLTKSDRIASIYLYEP